MKVAFPQRDGQVLAPWEGVGPRCILLLQPAQQNRLVTCRFFTRCLANLASDVGLASCPVVHRLLLTTWKICGLPACAGPRERSHVVCQLFSKTASWRYGSPGSSSRSAQFCSSTLGGV